MFASIANKRKIDEATSAKDSVAPVYLLEDIWQIVQSSGPETAAGFVDYTNKRLANRNPVVKQKALRLVKFICLKGSSDFKRNIAKHGGTVRELQHYRGDPDPFKGDIPNQKVREYAKEAMEAMFAPTETPSYSTSTTAAINSRIQGFGSSNASENFNGSTASSKQGSGMMGFGNPRSGYEAPADGSSRSEGLGGMLPVGGGALSPKAIMGSIAAKGNEFFQGRRGPGILNNDDQTGYSSDEADRGYEKPRVNGTSASSLGPLRSENGARGDGRDEEQLVNQICTPGGLRVQPTREDLSIFVDTASGLGGTRVAECLAVKVDSTSWQASLRALCALEAIIQHGHTAACGEIAVHFQSHPNLLDSAMGSPQASVRQRASRVLQLLGVGGASSSLAPAANAPRASGNAPDLLGGLDDTPQPAEAPRQQTDLLGGLMDPPPVQPATEDAGGLLSGLQPPAVQQQSGAQPSSSLPTGDDLFQGLSTGGQQSAFVPPNSSDPFGNQTASTASQHQASNALADLMGGPVGSTFAVAPAQAQPPADIFSFGGASGPKPEGELSDMFSGLSTSSVPDARQSNSQKVQQPLHSSSSFERSSDPLSSLGIPQAQQAPMGLGVSAQRGSSPAAPPPLQGQNQGFSGMQQQLTPQQMQYLRQMQYMQYMQMQAMQARGMGGGFMPQFGANPPEPSFPGMQAQPPAAFPQPLVSARQPSYGGAGLQSSRGSGPILLDGGSSNSSLSTKRSSSIGISQQSDFDFVGDHVKTLRGRK